MEKSIASLKLGKFSWLIGYFPPPGMCGCAEWGFFSPHSQEDLGKNLCTVYLKFTDQKLHFSDVLLRDVCRL